MAGTGSEQRPLIWEVTVDRQAFDARQLRNGTYGGLSDRLVEMDRRLDNALPGSSCRSARRCNSYLRDIALLSSGAPQNFGEHRCFVILTIARPLGILAV